MATKSPAFQFYVRDWLCSPTVKKMTGDQVKVYVYLLCASWLEHPRATLPMDDNDLAGLGNTSIEWWLQNKHGVLRAFEVKDNRYVSEKLFKVSDEQYDNSKNGKKGGNPNFDKGKHNPYYKPKDNPIDKPKDNPSSSTSSSTITTPKSSKENIIPSEIDFLNYCKEVLSDKYQPLEFSLKAKFESWVADGWKDGNGKEIKNWKTKIKNTIPHLKPMYNGNATLGKDRMSSDFSGGFRQNTQ